MYFLSLSLITNIEGLVLRNFFEKEPAEFGGIFEIVFFVNGELVSDDGGSYF